jgi:hypothetical protein
LQGGGRNFMDQRNPVPPERRSLPRTRFHIAAPNIATQRVLRSRYHPPPPPTALVGASWSKHVHPSRLPRFRHA